MGLQPLPLAQQRSQSCRQSGSISSQQLISPLPIEHDFDAGLLGQSKDTHLGVYARAAKRFLLHVKQGFQVSNHLLCSHMHPMYNSLGRLAGDIDPCFLIESCLVSNIAKRVKFQSRSWTCRIAVTIAAESIPPERAAPTENITAQMQLDILQEQRSQLLSRLIERHIAVLVLGYLPIAHWPSMLPMIERQHKIVRAWELLDIAQQRCAAVIGPPETQIVIQAMGVHVTAYTRVSAGPSFQRQRQTRDASRCSTTV